MNSPKPEPQPESEILHIPFPGAGWNKPRRPVTGRHLLKFLLENDYALDHPIEIAIYVQGEGDEHISCYPFAPHEPTVTHDEEDKCYITIEIGDVGPWDEEEEE